MLSDELYDLAWFALVTFVLSFVSLVVSTCIIRVTIIDIKQSSMANTTSPTAIYLFFISLVRLLQRFRQISEPFYYNLAKVEKGQRQRQNEMNLFEGETETGANAVFPMLTIIPALIGSGLLLAGLTIHPLMEIDPKVGDEIKQISIWRVTTQNRFRGLALVNELVNLNELVVLLSGVD